MLRESLIRRRWGRPVASLLTVVAALVVPAALAVEPQPPTLRWRVGDIDPKFGLRREEVASLVMRAASVWEKASGKRLFQHDPKSGFPINLVYDQRQERAVARLKADLDLKAKEKALDKVSGELDGLEVAYDRESAAIDRLIDEYETRLKNYNKRARAINAKGSATEQEDRELKAEREALSRQDSKIDAREDAQEASRKRLNSLIDKEKELRNIFNTAVDSFNERFVYGKTGTVGVCSFVESRPVKIDIFAFESREELASVLAHELGHALGMKHVKSKEALMSDVDSRNDHGALDLNDADRAELKRVLGG